MRWLIKFTDGFDKGGFSRLFPFWHIATSFTAWDRPCQFIAFFGIIRVAYTRMMPKNA
jgi:hypothetical protein